MLDDRSRYSEYDILRLFSAICVIFIHISAAAIGNFAEHSWLLILNKFFRFSVPAFAFLTGVLVGGGAAHSIGTKSYFRFSSRKANRIIVPYIVWSAIYIGLSVLMNNDVIRSITIKSSTKHLLLGTAWYHLYFVPTIFVIYLLTPISLRLKTISKIMIFSSWITSVVISYSFSVINSPLPIKLLDSVFIYLPYVFLGLWYSGNKSMVDNLLARSWPALLLIGSIINYFQTILGFGETPEVLHRIIFPSHIIMVILAVLGMSLWLSDKYNGFDHMSSSFSAYSYSVYLSHPFFLLLLVLNIERYDLLYLWRQPVFIFLSIGLIAIYSTAFTWMLKKIKFVVLRLSKQIMEYPVVDKNLLNTKPDNSEIN